MDAFAFSDSRMLNDVLPRQEYKLFIYPKLQEEVHTNTHAHTPGHAMTSACGVKRNIVTKRWTLTTVAAVCLPALYGDVHKFWKCFGLCTYFVVWCRCYRRHCSSPVGVVSRICSAHTHTRAIFSLSQFSELKPIIWLSKFPTNYVISCTCEWIYQLIQYFSIFKMFAMRSERECWATVGIWAEECLPSQTHAAFKRFGIICKIRDKARNSVPLIVFVKLTKK